MVDFAEDNMAAILFLASKEAGWITGLIMPVDGGVGNSSPITSWGIRLMMPNFRQPQAGPTGRHSNQTYWQRKLLVSKTRRAGMWMVRCVRVCVLVCMYARKACAEDQCCSIDASTCGWPSEARGRKKDRQQSLSAIHFWEAVTYAGQKQVYYVSCLLATDMRCWVDC